MQESLGLIRGMHFFGVWALSQCKCNLIFDARGHPYLTHRLYLHILKNEILVSKLQFTIGFIKKFFFGFQSIILESWTLKSFQISSIYGLKSPLAWNNKIKSCWRYSCLHFSFWLWAIYKISSWYLIVFIKKLRKMKRLKISEGSV